MNTLLRQNLFGAYLGAMFVVAWAGENTPTRIVEAQSGSVRFVAPTNAPGVEVSAKSGALVARASVSRDGNGLTLQQIDASLPVKSLATGMKMRDEHMRKYIFTTQDGQEPDLHFTAAGGACASNGLPREFACDIGGELSIRGISRPLNIKLRVKEGASSETFDAAGEGLVKLSDYGIVPPSQFGVKPSNEVIIHLDFNCKQTAIVATSRGAQ